ncbi:hypothetical protein HJFPF1_08317 [Paramyrothecium foliicola]|nr:hypothetical protein HJFPF1_08317 [Paramyrothecium foliicola]
MVTLQRILAVGFRRGYEAATDMEYLAGLKLEPLGTDATQERLDMYVGATCVVARHDKRVNQ